MVWHVRYNKSTNSNSCIDPHDQVQGSIIWKSWFELPDFETADGVIWKLVDKDTLGFEKALRQGTKERWRIKLPTYTGLVEIHSADSGQVYVLKWQGLFHGEIQVLNQQQQVVVSCPVDSLISDFTLDVVQEEEEWNSPVFLMLVAYCRICGFFGRYGLRT